MGWPAKNDKTRNSRFYDLTIERYKTKFKILKIYLAYQNDFLVPYNSKIIKSQISCFVVLSWPPHLPILLTFSLRECFLDFINSVTFK